MDVLLRVADGGVPCQFGRRLDVRPVEEQVRHERVAGTVEGDVLVDARAAHPPLEHPARVGVRGEDKEASVCRRTAGTEQCQGGVVERQVEDRLAGVSLYLLLHQVQHASCLVDTLRPQSHDVTPAQPRHAGEEEGTLHFGVQAGHGGEAAYLVLGEHRLGELVLLHEADVCGGVDLHVVLLHGKVQALLELVEVARRCVPREVLAQVVVELQAERPVDAPGVERTVGGETDELCEGSLHHLDVLAPVLGDEGGTDVAQVGVRVPLRGADAAALGDELQFAAAPHGERHLHLLAVELACGGVDGVLQRQVERLAPAFVSEAEVQVERHASACQPPFFNSNSHSGKLIR